MALDFLAEYPQRGSTHLALDSTAELVEAVWLPVRLVMKTLRPGPAVCYQGIILKGNKETVQLHFQAGFPPRLSGPDPYWGALAGLFSEQRASGNHGAFSPLSSQVYVVTEGLLQSKDNEN